MEKISEGEFEIFTDRLDAIDKLMQMQGGCREQIGDDKPIVFICTKKGKITVTAPSRRRLENDSSISLSAYVTERDGKTFVIYHTAFSRPMFSSVPLSEFLNTFEH